MSLEGNVEKFSFGSCFPSLFTMSGLVLIYVNHGANEYLGEVGLSIYYSFSVVEGLLGGLLLGFISFIVISLFVDQVIRKKSLLVNITKSFTKSFFLEEKPKEWEVYAHLTASLNIVVSFLTCIIALLLTPGTIFLRENWRKNRGDR